MMIFNRPPRIQTVINPYELKITYPPQIADRPKINWLLLILPVLLTGLIYFLISNFNGGMSSSYFLTFIPFMLVGILVSIFSYVQQNSTYQKELKTIRDDYENYLFNKETGIEAQIEQQKEEQRNQFFEINPDPLKCIDFVTEYPPVFRLGERRPEDDDFLRVRIGLGRARSQVVVQIPDENHRDKNFPDLCEQAKRIKETSQWIDGAPILTDLKRIGCLGIAGNAFSRQSLTRSMLTQLCAHHWVSEVELAVFCNEGESQEWEWVAMLPHKSKLFRKGFVELKENDTANPWVIKLEKEIRKRKSIVESSPKANVAFDSRNLPAIVLVLDGIPAKYDYAAFSMLLESSREVGIYPIILENSFQSLPAECDAVVEFSLDEISYKETGTGKEPIRAIVPDLTSQASVEQFASAMAKIRWQIPSIVSDPPSELRLIDFFGQSIDDLDILKWWDEDPPFGFLKAPIGKFSPTDTLLFDLSEQGHGPHGIIGGTTGSGKSETLRTLILSLALTHNPYDLNFALIDFKGGAAFRGLEKLPHVVGLITDIEDHVDYANRVLESLAGEIRTRKQILNNAQEVNGLVKAHVDDYRQLPIRRPLPHLVIIFDEFAEFREYYRAESQQLVSFARVGRSLGIHLILCAQSPSAVVDDQIRQNSKFKICLPVRDPSDSTGFIGIPNAFELPVGLAYFKVNSPLKVRIAYSGDYLFEHDLPENAIVKVHADQSREIVYPVDQKRWLQPIQTESARIIQKIVNVAEKYGYKDIPKVWEMPLPDLIPLEELLSRAKVTLAWNQTQFNFTSVDKVTPGYLTGLIDDPANQKQLYLRLNPDGKPKNLLVLGASGSGKSVLLQTLIMSIAYTRTPDQANIYCLDLGALTSLLHFVGDSNETTLPHIPREGGIISFSERERIIRLLNYLNDQIRKREEIFHASKPPVNNLSEFNKKQKSRDEQLPEIFLMIDGLAKSMGEHIEQFCEKLDVILKNGPGAGIYVVITANQPDDVHNKILANFNSTEQILFLQPKSDQQIHSYLGSAASASFKKKIELGEEIKPGRGLINSNPLLEFQVALPAFFPGEDFLQRIIGVVQDMGRSWKGKRPAGIDTLHLNYERQELFMDQYRPDETINDTILLGIDNESLKSVGISLENDGPIYQIVSESSKQGKTSIISNILYQLVENFTFSDKNPLVVFGFPKHTLKTFSKHPGVKYLSKHTDLPEVLDQLEELLSTRSTLFETSLQTREDFDPKDEVRKLGYIIIAIDDFITAAKRINDDDQIERLARLAEHGGFCGFRFILTQDYSSYTTSNDFLDLASDFGCGVALGGTECLDYFNDAKANTSKTSGLPVGRGYLVNQKKARLIQAAT